MIRTSKISLSAIYSTPEIHACGASVHVGRVRQLKGDFVSEGADLCQHPDSRPAKFKQSRKVLLDHRFRGCLQRLKMRIIPLKSKRRRFQSGYCSAGSWMSGCLIGPNFHLVVVAFSSDVFIISVATPPVTGEYSGRFDFMMSLWNWPESCGRSSGILCFL